ARPAASGCPRARQLCIRSQEPKAGVNTRLQAATTDGRHKAVLGVAWSNSIAWVVSRMMTIGNVADVK
ncbi:MAG TPA: hypothetical protein DDZ22_02705, partial [Massilia sp.]|nr:hypothetical protein [Massilia sp.]